MTTTPESATPAADQSMPVDYDPFAHGELSATFATTEAQREIFAAAHWSDEASAAYNESFWLSFRQGHLDVAALTAAFGDLVARHEALRTTVTPDGLTACVAAAARVPLEMLDLSALPATTRAAALADAKHQAVTSPFDLARGPLLRTTLVQIDAEEWVLLVTAHHLVCDGWSAGILVKDLAAFYSARRAGRVPAPPPPTPFSAFAAAERSHRQSPAGAADEAYWIGRLQREDAPLPVLDLPIDYPRPAERGYASRREDLTVPRATVARLKSFAAAQGISYFTLLFTGFQALMQRLTGAAEVIVGVPAAGQTQPGMAGVVGHCVHLLPILGDVDPRATFAALLKKTRTTLLDAFDHQRVTYGSVLAKLKLPRDPSRLPLVSVIFNLDQGLAAADRAFAGLEARFGTTPRARENFELFLNVIEIDGETTLELQYLTALFDPASARAHLASYWEFLATAAASPDRELGGIPLLAPVERTQLAAWNDVTAPLPAAPTLPALIAAQARMTPAKIAVRTATGTLTYAAMMERAERVAFALAAAGVKPGVLVAVSLTRDLNLLPILIGVMRAGGAYVPIDPTLPKARADYILADTGATLVVVNATTRGAFEAGKLRLLDAAVLAEGARDAPLPAVRVEEPDGDDLAYVIYTSGSTGRPKGVLVPHRGVAVLLEALRVAPGLSAADRQLAVTTISFDVHVPDLYLPLVVGAEVYVADQNETMDGNALTKILAAHAVTSMTATPATWRLLLDAAWAGEPRLKAISTGEPLPSDLAARLLPRVGELWNLYGPTETTVYSTGGRIDAAAAPILIGRPLPGTTLFIVNAAGLPVPIGVVGELLIGGAGVTRGYLNRPELTAERFVDGPDGSRVYRSGDLARFRRDGRVECLGRSDDQVKVRGFRIELGEIEAALADVPGVARAAVGVRDRTADDRRLVAWYVPAGAALAAADLRAALARVLPDYMVPQHFVVTAALPLTTSGKIDRQRLPSPFAAAEPPSSVAPTKIPRRLPGAPLAASLVQRRILALEQAEPGLTIFNLPTGFRIFGPLDHARLERAIFAFVARHEALRMAFHRDGGTPQPYVVDHAQPRLPLIDFSALSPAEQATRLVADFDRAAATPMDTTRAPIFIARLYRLGAAEHVLFIMAHQATWDGWSFDLFINETAAFYAAAGRGAAPTLPALRIGYGDFALWHNQELARHAYAADLDFWRAELTPLPPRLTLRDAKPRPPRFSYRGHSVAFSMDRALADALLALGRETGATLFVVMLALYKILLHKKSGATAITVAIPVRGRLDPDVENIVGTFVNQVLVRTEIDVDESAGDLIKRLRLKVLTAMSHDAAPFDAVAMAVGGQDPERAPLADAAFSFQDARGRVTAFGDLPFKQLNVEPRTAATDLNFWIKESYDGLTGSMNYATDVYTEAAMRTFMDDVVGLARAVAADPRSQVAKLGTASERGQRLAAQLAALPAVEAATLGLPALREAQATTRFDADSTPKIALFYALKPGEFVTHTDLRRVVRKAVGDDFVPHFFVELPALPRAAGGMVDIGKLALPTARAAAATDSTDGSPVESGTPRGAAEIFLASAWADILGVAPASIARHSNFFELGGHSLLAIQMIGRVERDTGVKLNRMAVTVNSLAQVAALLAAAANGKFAAEAAATPAPTGGAPATDPGRVAAPPQRQVSDPTGVAARFWQKLRGKS